MNPPENDPISKLIVLKRYERMPDGFADELIHRLHVRQRQDLMTQSLGSMIKERLLEFWEALRGPRLAMAGVAVLALLLGLIYSLPERSGQHDVADVVRLSDLPLPPGFEVLPPEKTTSLANFGTKLPPAEAARLSPVLLSNHFVGGFPDELREAISPEFVKPLVSLKFEVMPLIQFEPETNDEPASK